MTESRSLAQEAAEDVFFGQVVIIFARWFVILGGVILVLWSATTVRELSITVPFVVALMAMNFFVHGRYLLERPANRTLLIALSFLDLAIITGIISVWKGEVGLRSQFYTFYYPVLAAFAFVFPPRLSLVFAAVGLGTYTAVVFLAEPTLAMSSVDLEVFALRLITMATMTFLGTFYWRVQRNRRRATTSRAAGSAL